MPAGSFYYGYQVTSGWNLNQGSGNRTQSFQIPFGVKFSKPPTVVAALSGLDVGNQHNTRVYLTVQNVTNTGFTLVVTTWADTILYSVWGMWYAELGE